MKRRANAAEIDAGLSNLPRLPVERVAEKIIVAAVNELVAIVGALLEENKALAKAASPGFVRRKLREL
jgi:hypothetical protein